MSTSIPGPVSLPSSPYPLDTYWGRVRHSLDICDPRTLFTSDAQLRTHINVLSQYKNGIIGEMTPEVWRAKQVVDATLHPDTGEKVLLPFRMSAFVFSNLVVTAGMLTPNMSTRAMLAWQITNQSLNVAINASNANKSTPLSYQQMAVSYLLAVSSSCGVALGLNSLVPRLKNVSPSTKIVLGRLVPFAAVVTAGVVNVCVMRGQEILGGIDVYPHLPNWSPSPKAPTSSSIPNSASSTPSAANDTAAELTPTSTLGKSRYCATLAVAETALSRVLNATPIMVIPPLVLLGLQKRWSLMKTRPGLVLPVNLGVIFVTSIFALPLALGAFPQRQRVGVEKVEEGVREVLRRRGGEGVREVEFNRGI